MIHKFTLQFSQSFVRAQCSERRKNNLEHYYSQSISHFISGNLLASGQAEYY